MNQPLPPHMLEIYRSVRRFKQIKRAQLQHALEAIHDLRLGCAYLPTGSKPVMVACDALKKLQQELCVKQWGR